MRPPALRVVNNPPNPWQSTRTEWLDEESLGPPTRLEIFEDHTQSILSRNRSPDIGFEWSVNAYRGCYHACAYCYARPSHEYLDFGAGTDFDRKIVIKPKAATLLAKAFDRKSWKGDRIVFSGNTDCYQAIEASYGLTRACLEVCLEYRNPVGIITKGTLIERDIDLLVELADKAHCTIGISIPFADAANARAIEPYAPSPQRRFRTVEKLARAGLCVSVVIAPIIPGLNDGDIPAILESAKAAGARWAGGSLLRLPRATRPVFIERLEQALPLRAGRVLSQLAQCREGQTRPSDFGTRMRGEGARWQVIEQLMVTHKRRLGFEPPPPLPDPSPFRRPERVPKKQNAQLSLF